MARAGDRVNETLIAPGTSASELSKRFLAAFSARTDHRLAHTGPDTFHLVRTYRPTWAVVGAVAGVVAVGLGLLLLLVRRTETCAVSIVDGPTGAVVNVAGRLLPEVTVTLRAVVDGTIPASYAALTDVRDREPEVRPVIGSAPPSVALVPPAARVPPGAASLRPDPDPRQPGPAAFATEHTILGGVRGSGQMRGIGALPSSSVVVRLLLDEGRQVNVQPGEVFVIGRNPSGEPGETPLKVHAPGVSKTHLRIWNEGGTAWVDDLHSTNGTTVAVLGSGDYPVVPSHAVPVAAGAVVRFGGVEIRVL